MQQDALSINDVIKNSLLESGIFQNTLTVDSVVGIIIALIASMLLGFYISIIYKVTYRGVVYSQTFSMSLIGMTVLTCMVTLAISTNVVLSLGMVGALSIVRFRTAVKEPFDLMFMFWAITTGIAAGAKMFLLVCIGAAVVTIFVFIMSAKVVNSKVYIAVIRFSGSAAEDEIYRIMSKERYTVKSRTSRKEDTELALEVRIAKNKTLFAEKIKNLEGVSELTLVQYNGEYYG
ncbi:MAG: DUF4956 domain-containing protein [Ruminococcus sp.]|nr:DUF4956 domain-containing protein [Ruminococcus sp.]